jgi:hypothetical protein
MLFFDPVVTGNLFFNRQYYRLINELDACRANQKYTQSYEKDRFIYSVEQRTPLSKYNKEEAKITHCQLDRFYNKSG